MRAPLDQHRAQSPQALPPPDESQTMKDELVAATAKVSPAVVVAAAEPVFGLTLQDWVYITAIAYTVLQIALLIRNEFFRKKGRK